MSKAIKRRIKRHRRLNAMRIRSGKRVIRHILLSGRTGGAHAKKTPSMPSGKSSNKYRIDLSHLMMYRIEKNYKVDDA